MCWHNQHEIGRPRLVFYLCRHICVVTRFMDRYPLTTAREVKCRDELVQMGYSMPAATRASYKFYGDLERALDLLSEPLPPNLIPLSVGKHTFSKLPGRKLILLPASIVRSLFNEAYIC